MAEVYSLQDLLILGVKIKFSTKIELFKNRLDYEQALITKKVAIIYEGQIHLKVTELINAINSTKISETSLNDLKNIMTKYPGQQIDVTDSILIISIPELEKAFGNKSKKPLSIGNNYMMGLNLNVELILL